MFARSSSAAFALTLLLFGFTACGDDDASPRSDVAADVAEDTATPADTATPEDTGSIEDTAPDSGDADANDLDADATDARPADDTAAPGDAGPTDVADAADPDAADPDAADVAGQDDTADATDPDAADAVDPDPYEGLVDDALRAVLAAETTAGHTPLGYTPARDAMYAVGGIDDVGGRIACIYTGRTVDATGSRTPDKNCARADGTPMSCGFNTEHTFARYFLRAELTEGSAAYHAAEGDIHHLHPSDEDVNNARWHFDFGETACALDGDCKVNEESQLGERPGISGYAHCPTGNLDLDHVCLMRVRAARQGDVARGMFYMAVRYDMALEDAMEAALRAWNLADPPDDHERARNDAIEAAQGNRNPFVDRPDLVDRISAY